MWILRDISVENVDGHTLGIGVNAWALRIDDIPIVNTPYGQSYTGIPYRWTDIRIAVVSGQELVASSTDQYWGWWITGYQLSAT